MSLRELEKELLAEKPWPLRGEVDSKSRPKDSLIDEHVQFTRRGFTKLNEAEKGAAPTEIRSGENDELERKANYLESLIKNRICNNLFDNVTPIDKSLLEDRDANPLQDGDDLNTTKNSKGLTEEYAPASSASKNAAAELENNTKNVLVLWSDLKQTLNAFCADVHIPKAIVTQSAAERAEHDQVQAV